MPQEKSRSTRVKELFGLRLKKGESTSHWWLTDNEAANLIVLALNEYDRYQYQKINFLNKKAVFRFIVSKHYILELFVYSLEKDRKEITVYIKANTLSPANISNSYRRNGSKLSIKIMLGGLDEFIENNDGVSSTFR